ncbi:hypothetical protein [Arenimonas terrae]|jgi:hypothetical protein|uniref:Uncharacterized protein n=1 Tax=Arenimonas terrae TaxID=2546226 RepID=A0A5C4RWL7_9GAMM|nr:hypothetical protein [Arenimonas terrae]TNJ35434.1 hypothetical protein E1B00_06670 [Arenimonas terrae]
MTFPNSPKLVRGGLVLVDPKSGSVRRVISLQYNPDTLSRTLQVQGFGENGERSEALRLRGPAVETIKIDAEIDAADHLEFPEQHAATIEFGIQPQLAALESLVNPSSTDLLFNELLSLAGTIEIAPSEAPLALFVWSRQRVLAVRVTDFSITEEAFDPDLNPLRAKVSLGMRVLSINDVGLAHKAGALFLGYLQSRERLAAKTPGGGLSALGIGGIP